MTRQNEKPVSSVVCADASSLIEVSERTLRDDFSLSRGNSIFLWHLHTESGGYGDISSMIAVAEPFPRTILPHPTL